MQAPALEELPGVSGLPPASSALPWDISLPLAPPSLCTSFPAPHLRRTLARLPRPAPSQVPETGSITGSDMDLRKLTQKDTEKMLLAFGVTPEILLKVTDRCVSAG
jgi:hypothetical protein